MEQVEADGPSLPSLAPELLLKMSLSPAAVCSTRCTCRRLYEALSIHPYNALKERSKGACVSYAVRTGDAVLLAWLRGLYAAAEVDWWDFQELVVRGEGEAGEAGEAGEEEGEEGEEEAGEEEMGEAEAGDEGGDEEAGEAEMGEAEAGEAEMGEAEAGEAELGEDEEGEEEGEDEAGSADACDQAVDEDEAAAAAEENVVFARWVCALSIRHNSVSALMWLDASNDLHSGDVLVTLERWQPVPERANEAVEWMWRRFRHLHPWFDRLRDAAFEGDVPGIRALGQYAVHPDTCAHAARGRRLQAFKDLRQLNYPWDHMCFAHAAGGVGPGPHPHLGLLQWLLAEECPWSSVACEYAAGRSLPALQWLRARSCPWDLEKVLRTACRRGNVAVLDWIARTEPAAPWGCELTECAARHNRLRAFRWLLEVKNPPCPVDFAACLASITDFGQRILRSRLAAWAEQEETGAWIRWRMAAAA